ncbi:uncharacterized protein G2W53_036859 [Senna tora]|uniref:Uncharacterized protein n=1 Tax=Senna tora TaxID=362788 RepID=A0A834SUP0_9FABA|nr:uncharacterized protein G2W53_036859 [Senna tora]
MSGRDIIIKDLIKCIENGTSTYMRTNPWVSGIGILGTENIKQPHDRIRWVSDIMDGVLGWRWDVIMFVLLGHAVEGIRRIDLSNVETPEKWL